MHKKISRAELIIFDLFGTILVCYGTDHIIRPGTPEVLEKLKNKTLVVATDEPVISAKKVLGEYARRFARIYGKEHLIEENRQRYKNLGQICVDFSVGSNQAVMISDDLNGSDSRSAEKYGVPFILVPRDSSSLVKVLDCRP